MQNNGCRENEEVELTEGHGNGIENQKPDPSCPAVASTVGNGDWTSKDSDKGEEPLARDGKREANVAVAEWHDLRGVNVLCSKLIGPFVVS